MIEALTNRFYLNEQGVAVNNGLSTEIIAFPSDRLPENAGLLKQKIQRGMNFASRFVDEKELNALLYLSKESRKPSYHESENTRYLTLGLYLFFADECSRTNPDTTFLTAMRNARATLRPGYGYEFSDLFGRMKKTLDSLGMKKSHGQVLLDWFKHADYTIQGEKHAVVNGELAGAYAQLAREIERASVSKAEGDPQKPGLNLAVSYALANKAHVEKLSAQEAYDRTRKLAHDPEEIRRLIKIGDRMREEQLIEKTHENVPMPANDNRHQQVAEKKSQAKAIFSLMTDEALQLLFHEGYCVSYSETKNLRQSYPKEDLSGVWPRFNELNRDSVAIRDARYSLIFLSEGGIEKRDDITRQKAAAQTLMHESMHMALDHMSEKEQNTLWQAVDAVHDEIAKAKPVPQALQGVLTTEVRPLSETLDYQAKYYNGYCEKFNSAFKGDTRRAEVVCNLYGRMNINPWLTLPNTRERLFAEMPALKALVDKINELVPLAAERSMRVSEVSAPAVAVGK